MAILKHKTRGMITPQGMQRVYFCCHPDDFERYFKTISEDILKKQNCAIWYVEDYNTTYDEQFFNALKGMQLFVIPVTTNFLFLESHAFSVEFKFAIKNNIPVLPLMQERGLEEIFNKKCGDLQFLDKNITDITAISYDEKLEKYLNSVLVGDELAEKIRAAFDAYVFLSYRKKDRKYAQELMRLIHKNDFCRDIAIWYDEFLTPGEDFNNSIKDALEKSELFVLAVTPNLVNEINYVMTEEYPKAKELGKVILPAELVATDKKELSKKYEDIPTPVDAHKDKELTEALLEAVKKIAIKENDGSPEHNFFIGLAYLSGVDVEIDHERALSLITSSAESGLLEAMTKLVEMYRTGTGVEQSYKIAIEWQEKVIEYYQQEYEKEPNENNLNSLFWSVINCGDYYHESHSSLAKEKEKYYIANTLLESAELNTKSNNFFVNLRVSYNKLGDISFSLRNIDDAEEYYEKEREVNEQIVKESNDVKALLALSKSYGRIAGINKLLMCDLKKTKYCYEKAVEINELVVKDYLNDEETKRLLRTSYESLSDYYWWCENNDEKAEEYSKKARGMKPVCSNNLTPDDMKKIQELRNHVANISTKIDTKEVDKKTERHKKLLELFLCFLNKLTKIIDSDRIKKYMILGYDKLSNIYKAEHNIEKAKTYCENALEIRIKLAEKSDALDVRKDLSFNYDNLANFYNSQFNRKKSKEYYEKAFMIRDKLIKETDDVNVLIDLAETCKILGDIYLGEKNTQKAKEYCEKALGRVVASAEITDKNKILRDLYNILSSIYRLENNIEKSKEYRVKAIKLLEVWIPLQ